MMQRKIRKWDAIHGLVDEEDDGCGITEEIPGSGPVISRIPMKTVEDMVEQNDNNLDGMINNVEPMEPPVPDQQEKKSVMDLLKEQVQRQSNPEDRVPVMCPLERELM